MYEFSFDDCDGELVREAFLGVAFQEIYISILSSICFCGVLVLRKLFPCTRSFTELCHEIFKKDVSHTSE